MKRKIKRFFAVLPSYLLEIICLLIFYPYGRLKYQDKHVWLVSERGGEARDNGFHFFRYIRTEHPDIKAYFVIIKNSPDINRVLPYGNVIYQNSFKHRLMFYGAEVLISTHLMGGYTTNQSFYMHFNKQKWFRKHRKVISLKHGITKDDLPILYKENASLDLLICGAKTEFEYIKQNFHYHDGEVQYTGFARFDSLYNNKGKNQVLVMPTWRKYLTGKSREEFIRSEYYRKWNGFLHNEKLTMLLNKYQLNLVFYPHFDIQPYIDLFKTPCSSIIIADNFHYDVQKLLIESKVLLTDYSSVFFDFAYMEKPVIYYQFDKERYRKDHYKQGYFYYETMGFGPLLEKEDEVINAIIEIIRKKFVVDETYLKRINDFFPIRDVNNCKRIFEAIIEVINK